MDQDVRSAKPRKRVVMIPNYEEGGPPLTDAQVLTFIEWFDFDQVHKTMVALNWRWASLPGPDGIPDLGEIKRTAAQMLHRLGPDCDQIASGGFEVRRHNGTVTLNFIVSSWEEYETEDDRTNNAPNLAVQKQPSVKVMWRQLRRGELLQCGDMWASHDPNTPERQAESSYNLQMQAVHNDYYNTPAYRSQYTEGSLWRPINLVVEGGTHVESYGLNQIRKLTIP